MFVPRKRDGTWLKMILNLFVKTSLVHSSTENKDEILDCFRNKELEVLVCTTLLERGITIPSVQVVVFKGNHSVFTTASLIQIFGRVGRSLKILKEKVYVYVSFQVNLSKIVFIKYRR